jgi:hypothetical protein
MALSEEEVIKFKLFSEEKEQFYKKNIYNKGFFNNLKDIVKGF